MYFGSLNTWAEHARLVPAAVAAAIEAVRRQDLAQLPAGRYEIEGEAVFFMVQEVLTKPVADTRAEAHHRYADVQIVLQGHEHFGFAPADAQLEPVENRLDSQDIAFYPPPARETFFDLEAGMFLVLYPGEFHRPCCTADTPQPLRKIVIKIDRARLGLDG